MVVILAIRWPTPSRTEVRSYGAVAEAAASPSENTVKARTDSLMTALARIG